MFGKKNEETGGTTFDTEVVLGEQYKDKTTGLVGTATSVHFYEHACERVSLRYVNKDGDVKESSFDAPELIHMPKEEEEKQERTLRASRPGGPARNMGARNASVAR